MPEPGNSEKGFGMKVACTPCSSATCFMTRRKVDVVGGGERVGVAQVDLLLAGAPSWWENSTEMPIDSSMVIAWRRKSMPMFCGVWSK
ncbi:hypothetical protein SANTM175S_01747 [Streptomyces antimycoticus]